MNRLGWGAATVLPHRMTLGNGVADYMTTQRERCGRHGWWHEKGGGNGVADYWTTQRERCGRHGWWHEKGGRQRCCRID